MEIKYRGDETGVKFTALLEADTDGSGALRQTSVSGNLPPAVIAKGQGAIAVYIGQMINRELARRRRWWQNRSAIIGRDIEVRRGKQTIVGRIRAISTRSMTIEVTKPKQLRCEQYYVGGG